ncbi:zinc ribbon domain-containing protein [Sphingobacterium thalpophilum]|uniref:zinc ribbon domain-containing protein n=1 Tax=Sphingobacterium thalpophilum TaxID=259 RepID=UPI003D98B3FD
MFGFEKLPDNTNKIYLVLSIVAVYFIINSIQSEKKKLDNAFIELTKEGDEQQKSLIAASNSLIKLSKYSEYISNRYKINNPVSISDSIATINLDNDTSKNYIAAVELILPVYFECNAALINKSVYKIRFNWAKEKHSHDIEYFNKITTSLYIIGCMFVFLFLASLYSLRKQEQKIELNEEHKRFIDKYNLREKGPLKDNCQSCGRTFDSIITVSKNIDGTYNYSFCSECYYDGQFVKSFEDVSSLITTNSTFSDEEKVLYIERLQQLDRWNANKYPKLKKN